VAARSRRSWTQAQRRLPLTVLMNDGRRVELEISITEWNGEPQVFGRGLRRNFVVIRWGQYVRAATTHPCRHHDQERGARTPGISASQIMQREPRETPALLPAVHPQISAKHPSAPRVIAACRLLQHIEVRSERTDFEELVGIRAQRDLRPSLHALGKERRSDQLP